MKNILAKSLFNLFKVCFLISIFVVSGCVTTKISYVEEDKLPKEKVYRISEVYMKDGSVINLKDSEPKFKALYKGMANVIVYYDNDYNTKYIELKNADRLKIEILESNVVLTVLVIVGTIAAALLILLMLTLQFGNITG